MFTESSKPIAHKSSMMKKSSTFSFSQLAASTATGKSINFSQIAAAAAGGKNKKLADDSFRKWEEMRMRKLEAMNLLQQKKKVQLLQQKSDDFASTIKYNHQEAIQPPPIKPRKLSAQSPPPIMEKVSQHRCERQQLREHAQYPHRRKISLDANWYTDNIYSNQSIEDSDCDIVKQRPLGNSASFSFYPNNFHRCDVNGNSHANNININITNAANTQLHGDPSTSFIEPESENYEISSPIRFKRHRNYPKSNSCNFADFYRPNVDIANKDMINSTIRSRSVPKSHSFSTNRQTMRQYDMDLIEYQRYKRMMLQRYGNSHLFDGKPTKPRFVRRICDREGCFSETCLIKNIDNSQNININNNIVNNNNVNAAKIFNEWDIRNQNSSHRDDNEGRNGNNNGKNSGGDGILRDTFIDDIDSFDDDDFIFNDGFSFQEFPCQPERPRRHRTPRNPFFSSMQLDCFDNYFIRKQKFQEPPDNGFRRERSRIIIRNKRDGLNNLEEEDYTVEDCIDPYVELKLCNQNQSRKQSKKMLEAEPPSRYDEDTDSCSTELDLDDFNLDFEKYWEELEEKHLETSSSTELTNDDINDPNNNLIERDSNNNPVHFIDDIISSEKPSPIDLKREEYFQKVLPPKKLNFPSTTRPLGVAIASQEDVVTSTKRPLTLNNIVESPLGSPNQNNIGNNMFHDESKDFPKFHIIPNKTGLRISPLYDFNHHNSHSRNFSSIYSSIMRKKKKDDLKSTTRPLVFW